MTVQRVLLYPLYLLTTTCCRHVDRGGEDGGPKLDVTEWHRLKDELCRGVAMRLIATYDRSTGCKLYVLTLRCT